jgi:uroporphyrinogen decarboxylase
VWRTSAKGKHDCQSEPFLVNVELRGMEQSYVDLVANRDLVRHYLDKLFDFCYDNTLRICE